KVGGLFGLLRCLLTLFDELFNLLTADLPNGFVKFGPVAISRRLSPLLAAKLPDAFVELVPVRMFGGLAALSADTLVEFRAVALLDRLPTLPARFTHSHALGGFRGFPCH